LIRPLVGAETAAAPPGMMGLVEHHQVPGLGPGQQLGRTIATPHQVAGDQHARLTVPHLGVHRALRLALEPPRRVPAQPLPVVDGPVQIELLAQLDLPLAQDGLRRQHQDPLRPAGQPGLAQQQTRLNRLAQTHLVGDQQSRRPVVIETLKGPDLMGPRDHCARCFADPFAAIGPGRGMADEAPHQAARVRSGFRAR
jgi:hypothetical protein